MSLAGCGSPAGNTINTPQPTPSSSSPSTSEPPAAIEDDKFKDTVEISIATWDIENDISFQEDDAVFQAIAQKLNITVKPINLTWDDYGQKIQLWAASDQLPDIFSIDAIGTQYYTNWKNQQVIKALPKDLSNYPNLQEYMNSPDIIGLQEDGQYYCVPRKTYPSLQYNSLDRLVEYRWDLAQQAGITKEPETWDEFKAMLKAIVDKDPEGKKITGLTAVNIKQIGGFFWLYSNALATSDGSGTDYKWIKEDGKYIPAVFSQNALPSLKNMREMYDMNIIDKGLALTKGNEGYDKFIGGQAAAVLHGGGFTTSAKQLYIERWQKVYPDKNYTDHVKTLKPLKDVNGVASHPIFKTYWSESYFNYKLDDKKFDRILNVYDYLVSEEGREYLRWGIEGVDYKKEGDKYTIIDDSASIIEKYKSIGVFKCLAEWDEGFAYDMNSGIIDKALRSTAVEYIDWVKKNTTLPDFDLRLTYMSTPAKDKFVVLDHDDLLAVMLSKEPVETAWAEIVNAYKEKGLDDVISEVNAKAKELGIN